MHSQSGRWSAVEIIKATFIDPRDKPEDDGAGK